jgi:hypothetical protein
VKQRLYETGEVTSANADSRVVDFVVGFYSVFAMSKVPAKFRGIQRLNLERGIKLRWTKADVDENLPLDPDAINLFFQLISLRYEKGRRTPYSS